MSTQPEIFDLTIIGGGPTGLFAAFYAGLRQMKIKIIDSLEELGGQLTTLYPEKYIFDVAGFPKVIARDLAKSLVDQAMQYDPAVFLGETASHLERDEALGAYVITSEKNRHYTKTIIISAGAGAFAPKKLPIPDATHFEGRGVYYSVKSKAAFHGKHVLIVGGGDSAVDWANNLTGTAGQITLIHRRNQFRAHEDNVRRALDNGVSIQTFWELKSLQGTDVSVNSAVIFNNQTKEEKTLAVNAVLAQLGFNSSLGPIKTWGLNLDRGSILVDHHYQTNLPGVFAAGDVAGFDGKLKLIATGFGEACTAVNYAKTQIDPAARAFPGHSSEMTPQTLSTVVLDGNSIAKAG